MKEFTFNLSLAELCLMQQALMEYRQKTEQRKEISNGDVYFDNIISEILKLEEKLK